MAPSSQPPAQAPASHESPPDSHAKHAPAPESKDVAIATPPADQAQTQLARAEQTHPEEGGSSAPATDGVTALRYSSGAARLANELNPDVHQGLLIRPRAGDLDDESVRMGRVPGPSPAQERQNSDAQKGSTHNHK